MANGGNGQAETGLVKYLAAAVHLDNVFLLATEETDPVKYLTVLAVHLDTVFSLTNTTRPSICYVHIWGN